VCLPVSSAELHSAFLAAAELIRQQDTLMRHPSHKQGIVWRGDSQRRWKSPACGSMPSCFHHPGLSGLAPACRSQRLLAPAFAGWPPAFALHQPLMPPQTRLSQRMCLKVEDEDVACARSSKAGLLLCDACQAVHPASRLSLVHIVRRHGGGERWPPVAAIRYRMAA